MDPALIKQWLAVVDLPAIILCLGMFAYVLVLIKWHVNDGPFDFRDALLDPPKSGGIGLSKLGQLTALVVTTGVVLYFTVKDKLPDWIFTTYVGAWAGVYVASKFFPKAESTPSGDGADAKAVKK